MARADLPARTALGKGDVLSHLDVADATTCDVVEFEKFVSDTLFGLLSGVVFGPTASAMKCVSSLRPLLQNWDGTASQQAELDLVHFIGELDQAASAPVLVVSDSNMQTYWVVPTRGAQAVAGVIAPGLLAGYEEFNQWARVGWDLRLLQRPMLPGHP